MFSFKKLTLTALATAILAAAVSLLAGTAIGQSAIIAMPSADVLALGRGQIRFIAKFKPYDEEARKKFSSFIPRFIIGVGSNIEVGVNLLGNIQPGADATTIVPTVKWRFYRSEKHRITAVAGNNLYVPLRNRKYKAGTYTYAEMSKQLKFGTKFTAGGYMFTKNVVAPHAVRAGLQVAVEHPLTKKLILGAEWMSGRHTSGVLTAGLTIKFNKHLMSILSYSIANNRALQGNHNFLLAMGANF